MTDKAPRTHTVSTRLNDTEYAAFRLYLDAHPDMEGNESHALRRIVRETVLPAAAMRPPAAPDVKRKEKRQ